MHFIVKIFSEITIKSPPLRKCLVKRLRQNLSVLLDNIDDSIKVKSDWDRIEVYSKHSTEVMAAETAKVLSSTPGIANFSKVQPHEMGDLEHIFQKTLSVWNDQLAGKTYVVRVRRHGKHKFNSMEIERYVGSGLSTHTENAGVKLKNPDVTVRLEIKNDDLYVVQQQTPGLGGFPIGSQEPVLSLVSGGFDSTVSSYLMIKRGLRTHYCFFNLGGAAHESAVKEVVYFLWNKFSASHRVKFVTVNFEPVVSEIVQNVKSSHMGVVLKRMMLRAATKVADEMNIQALVTGEAVAQVSSQTLTNLAVIDSATDKLVLRPLIVMNKGDIIDHSRKIGTENFSASIPEYCGVISVKPTTCASEEKVASEEANFDMTVLDAAVAGKKVQLIDRVVDDLLREGDGPVVRQVAEPGPNSVVIDIRHPDEEELRPLACKGLLAEIELLKIPFFSLNTRLKKLDKQTEYLLYCQKGVMSTLHAAHLKDDGFVNVGVYRPEK
jgi:thiamine biosynthesis protein ThiI|tara:strand:- start:1306 stop:2784 length:1479 start_codon:yes stop_codon:yes gene_type:complete